MKKKICIIHGIGYGLQSEHYNFKRGLEHRLDAEVTFFDWNHTGALAVPHTQTPKYPYDKLREFVNEAIMDSMYVISNLAELVELVPAADMYIGHSAGAVIADEFSRTPRVLMGSPAQTLASAARVREFIKTYGMTTQQIALNIMNLYDVIAAPSQTGVNRYVKFGNGLWPVVNVLGAHTQYWSNDKTIHMIDEWFNRFVI